MGFCNQNERQFLQTGLAGRLLTGRKFIEQSVPDGNARRVSIIGCLYLWRQQSWLGRVVLMIRVGGEGIGASVMMGICLIWLLAAMPVSAQGTIQSLQTGSGQPLTTDQAVLQTGGFLSPMINFAFGFTTQENPAPGVFLDSFTVSFEDASSNVAVVATADAGGMVWAPASPGSVALDASQIQRQATTTPPGLTPVWSRTFAYSVAVPVPTAFTGSSVTVYFDLFDNQNAVMSLGWYDNLQVTSVPEPQPALLLALGLMLLALKGNTFKRRFVR